MDDATAIRFGTKAETLARLHGRLETATVLDLRHVTVERWRREPDTVLDELLAAFAGGPVAVRSSAIGEDAAHESRAGAYTSVLDVPVDDPTALRSAVDEVVASFGGDPADQVLVQPMLTDVAVAGVLTTFDVESGAPYYVVEYDDETGTTDTVTGGTTAQRSVLVHRSSVTDHVASPRLRAYLDLARELERRFDGAALDIEFALTRDGELVLLQVRRIGAARTWHPVTTRRVERALAHLEEFVEVRTGPRPGVAGERTVLGVMPDWNPAEILGARPRQLAVSLYRRLITRDVWRASRASMGYRDVPGEELMVVLGDRPFIDVRNSFNSFLPAALDVDVADRLVGAWVARLAEHPELHDRVEFDVAVTCVDLATRSTVAERHGELLSPSEQASWLGQLATLTVTAHDLGDDGSLSKALRAIDRLRARAGAVPRPPLRSPADLRHVVAELHRCRALGTLPFAVLARHAFIGEAMLRSAVARGALAADRLDAFRGSLRTVSGDLSRDHDAVLSGTLAPEAFLARHGHLRPGTYDITSLRYDERADILDGRHAPEPTDPPPSFELSGKERRALDVLLEEAGLRELDSGRVLDHARAAIVARERAKHAFTRSLSDALADLTTWGHHHGLSRDDLANLDIELLERCAIAPPLDDLDRELLATADAAEAARRDLDGLRLGYLVRDAADIHVVPLPRSVPSFVGRERVSGRVVVLGPNSPATSDLYGAVVAIESADPGFDWIFTHRIAGLVTRFGGTNSHMAIRCAEHGLPAAIGCGDRVFRKVVSARTITLDAGAGQLLPEGGAP